MSDYRKFEYKKWANNEWKAIDLPIIQYFSHFEYKFHLFGQRGSPPLHRVELSNSSSLMSHSKAILRIFHTGICPHCWECGLAHNHLKSWVDMIVANTGGHDLDQCSVPTKTVYHELEGGWTPAAVSCGASELWEGTQMWAGRNGLWFQFEGRGKDTFLVVLAASFVPFLPDLLLGVGHLTPNLFLQQLLAIEHVSTHPRWLLF